jgi:hypothetical protein
VSQRDSALPGGDTSAWDTSDLTKRDAFERQRCNPDSLPAQMCWHSVPWWALATFAIPVAGLIVAASAGRAVGAMIIGVLVASTIGLLAAWIYGRFRG